MGRLNWFARIRALDPILTGILALLFLILLILLILLFRRPKDQTCPLRDALAAKELELRDAQTVAGRPETLAEERKTEIDRLNGDLLKLDADAERASVAAARISGLKTELRGAQEEAGRFSARHQSQLDERWAEIDRLSWRIAELTKADEAKC